MRLIYEKSVAGRRGFYCETSAAIPAVEFPVRYRRGQDAVLPEVSELDVVRHYANLARKNFSVDTNFYPLGSCTMKYNPKIAEKIAALDGFVDLHPLLPQLRGGGMLAQGALEVLYSIEQWLCMITGMAAFTLQPLAGAHGELTGVMIIAAYHRGRGQPRKTVIVPDSSHGTNPASAAIAGYDVVVVPTGPDGCMDTAAFKQRLSPDTAAVMLTCPNTLGIFNPRIKEICDAAHQAGALVYYDGANLNAIMGKIRPADIGFDVMHVNLHKTFATPHGGGGPGAGPVGVSKELIKYLPVPRVVKRSDGTLALHYQEEASIGFIAPFYGNFSVILKALVYMVMLGGAGLRAVSETAVLNANYCLAKLRDVLPPAYARGCMHEFVVSLESVRQRWGVTALDIAKYLIDHGIHPPTVYFPLIVKEALMIEPTETESKQTLDDFIQTLVMAVQTAAADPAVLREAPLTTPVRRLDETKAARDLVLRWRPDAPFPTPSAGDS